MSTAYAAPTTVAETLAALAGGARPVAGGTEGATLSEGMKAGVALATASKGVAINMNFTNWYSQLNKEIEQRTGELITGTIKPDEFISTMQTAADTVAADPDIKKFTR